MNFLTNFKKPTFFITKNFTKNIIEKSNLILSPEFYWAKRVSLNVSFSYEVKSMAPSIFDGILPKGKFEYKVFKIKPNEFVIIAYDLEQIKAQLTLLGVNLDLVEKIYTAQSEFLNNDISLRINDDFGIFTCKDVVTYAPINILPINNTICIEDTLKDKKLSSEFILSQRFKSIQISKKQFNILIIIFIMLNSIAILNIIKLHKDKNLLENQKNTFIKNNNLPSTNFQIQSIKDELLNIKTTQNSFRESIFYINKFKLSKEEFFEFIKFDKSSLVISVKLENKKRETEFNTYLAKKLKIIKHQKNGKNLKIEIKI